MGEIMNAYKVLNEVLGLNLSKDQMLAAEASYKIDLATRMKFPASMSRSALKFSADWEVTAQLQPRRKALTKLAQGSLKTLTSKARKDIEAKLGGTGLTTRRG